MLSDVKFTVRIGSIRDLFTRLSRVDLKESFKELRGPARFDQRPTLGVCECHFSAPSC